MDCYAFITHLAEESLASLLYLRIQLKIWWLPVFNIFHTQGTVAPSITFASRHIEENLVPGNLLNVTLGANNTIDSIELNSSLGLGSRYFDARIVF